MAGEHEVAYLALRHTLLSLAQPDARLHDPPHDVEDRVSGGDIIIGAPQAWHLRWMPRSRPRRPVVVYLTVCAGRVRAPSTISAIAIKMSTMPPMSRPIPIANKCGMLRSSPPAKATGAAASVFIATTR